MNKHTTTSIPQLHLQWSRSSDVTPATGEPDEATSASSEADDGVAAFDAMLLGALPRGKDLPAVLQPTLLSVESATELSRLVLVLLALGCKDNQKSSLLSVVRSAVAEQIGPEPGWAAILEQCQVDGFLASLAPRFEAHAAHWPFQRLGRNKAGALDYSLSVGPDDQDKDEDKRRGLTDLKELFKKQIKLPSVRNDDARMAAVLAGQASPAGLVDMVPDTAKFIDNLRVACHSATHPANLTSVHGTSGLDAMPQGPDLEAPGCISEFDYQTLQTEALISGAHQQPFTLLTTALVVWQGAPIRLRKLLQQDAGLSEQVTQDLSAMGVACAADIMAAYLAEAKPACNGVPPVFVVVPGESKPEVTLLSVISPYAHLIELTEARTKLAHARVAQAEQTAISELAALDLEHAEALAATPESGHKKLLAEQAKIRKALVAKGESRVRMAPFVPVPHRALQVGGSTPRNVCSGLTQVHHSANLAPVISMKKSLERRQQTGRMVFTPGALLRTPSAPKISLRVLVNDKAQRQAVFAALIADAVSRLLELRDAYAHQMTNRLASPVFAAADLAYLRESTEPWAYFIRGNSDFNYAEWREALTPLAVDVTKKVQQAIHKVEEGALNEFDSQLLLQCRDFLLQQHN